MLAIMSCIQLAILAIATPSPSVDIMAKLVITQPHTVVMLTVLKCGCLRLYVK